MKDNDHSKRRDHTGGNSRKDKDGVPGTGDKCVSDTKGKVLSNDFAQTEAYGDKSANELGEPKEELKHMERVRDITGWDSTITVYTDMGFQLCPKCEGNGFAIFKELVGSEYKQCPVCNGKMIINKQTGKPPE